MSPEDQQDDHRTEQPQPVTYRRRPQLVGFLVVGAVLGLVVGGSVGFFGPATQGSSLGQDVVLLGALGAILGAFVAAVVYLVADWASMRRTR